MAKSQHHTLRHEIHYTVMIALVVSVLTTFFLGILLAEALWSTGLDHFSNVAQEARMERSKALFMEDIQRQLNEQLRVNAAQAMLPFPEKPDSGDDWQECIENCTEWCDNMEAGGICRNECGVYCNDEHPKEIQQR